MKIFTIENETNNITAHNTIHEPDAVPNAERFRNETGLAKLAANWPAARVIDIWNSLPGVTPVKKFKDRATAVNRIWKAIQNLGDTVETAEQLAPVPEAAPSGEVVESIPAREQGAIETTRQRAVIPKSPDAAVAALVARQAPDVALTEAPAKTKAARAKKTPVAAATNPGPRGQSKTSRVIELLKREGGVTLQGLMNETGWQAHTTRALMSAGGSLAKKHGLTITSAKGENGLRTYLIHA
jgi:hypothetical protein